jgi:hypothetical protein
MGRGEEKRLQGVCVENIRQEGNRGLNGKMIVKYV